MKNRLLWTASIVVVMLVILSAAPIQAAITFGRWRDINPTQYTADPKGSLRGIYVRNGGSGSIGAGDGWAVGGDNISNTQQPVLAHYDGFSWPIIASPLPNATYNSVNFCTNSGAPGVGLCSPNGDGSDGWIVGNSNSSVHPSGSAGGIALYWDGAALTVQDTGLSDAKNLTSVFMVCHSPAYSTGCPSGSAFVSGLTYAVGTNATNQGSIWAFSGDPKTSGGWIEQKVVGVPTTRYNSVYMFQDGAGNLEGFAVGEGGVVARLFSGGNTWTATSIGGAANSLLGIFVDQTNPIDAWAVGRGGQVWHFATGIWAGPVTPAGTSRDLYSVQLVSTSEGWIVGSNGTILHSTTLGGSNSWLTLTTPLQTAVGDGHGNVGTGLFSASFPSSGNGWASGANGVILQTGNSGCGSAVPQPCWGGSTNVLDSTQLNAVWELGSSDAWAGGLYNASNDCCSLIHWDGIKWHRANAAPSQTIHPDIWTIYMLSSGEGWAMGGNSTHTGPEALLWNGQSWNGQPIAGCGASNPCEPRSVFMLSGGTGGDGWAVGLHGEIWRHQSGSWTLFSQPTLNNLNGVFINNQGAPSGTPAGWAVGNTGTVLVLTITGGVPVWTAHAIPQVGSSNLNGVYFKDSTHGWIVGSSSTIVQTTDGGNTWSGGTGQVTGIATANLTSVFVDTFGTGSGNGDGWVVGDDQSSPGNVVFAHWDGVAWVYTPLVPPILAGSVTPGMSLRSVYLTGPEDGWAVGRPVTGGTLSGIIHLDPQNPPVVGQQATTTNSTSSSASSTAATTTSSSEISTSSSTSTTSEVMTSSTASTTAAASTVTVTSTPTTSTSSTSSVSTPLVMPAVPGFPWESIIVGAIVGMAALAIVRRRKR